jgi:hypothetical protein
MEVSAIIKNVSVNKESLTSHRLKPYGFYAPLDKHNLTHSFGLMVSKKGCRFYIAEIILSKEDIIKKDKDSHIKYEISYDEMIERAKKRLETKLKALINGDSKK